MRKLPENTESFIAPAKKTERVVNNQIEEVGFTSGENPNENVPTVPPTILDAHKNPQDNPECYAKMLSYEGERSKVEKFYIKFSRDGFLFDPWGAMSEGTQGRHNSIQGKPMWNYREVPKKAFFWYLKFLQSRNVAWKKNAEREASYG